MKTAVLLSFHLPCRTRVHHPLSSPEVPRRDCGLLHPILCESHHRVMDHVSEWYEVSKKHQDKREKTQL